MATKFYKKPSPKQAVHVAGRPIQFDQINIEVGIFKTDDADIQREFSALQARGVGGIFDITEAEYTAILEKKNPNSQQSYRDEFGKAIDPSRIVRPDNDLAYRAEESEVVSSEVRLPGNPAPPEPIPTKSKPAARRRA